MRAFSIARRFSLRRGASALLALVALTSACASAAGLTWAETSHEATATTAQRFVQVMYPFQNTSDKPVRITAVTTSCGCTTAGEHAAVYRPGERGVIPVTFEIGSRRGRQDKEILVFTDEGNPRPYALGLHVDIRTLYSIESQSLVTPQGNGRMREYEFTIAATSEKPIRVVAAASVLPLQTRIEPVIPGRKYVVHFAPYAGDKTPLVPGAHPSGVTFQIDVEGVGRMTEEGTVFPR